MNPYRQLFDRVRLAREGAAVERCHAQDHLKSYTVGHHSLDVATLITLCWASDHQGSLPSRNLLLEAIFHDIPECVTGDVPQPVKLLLGEKLRRVDREVILWLGVACPLTEEEREYLEVADRVELWLWCWEEARRGNEAFLPWVRGYDDHFKKNPPPESFRVVMEKVRNSGLERLDVGFLMELSKLKEP